ncbi:MAG: CDGSH iron-sulfur domain-containing protein [Rhodoblastus sp.]
MSQPVIAQKAPVPVEVEAGKTYHWCSCGKSARQPFCDGSHKGSDFSPLAWTAPETKTVYMCACKHTKKSPLCDGAHKAL